MNHVGKYACFVLSLACVVAGCGDDGGTASGSGSSSGSGGASAGSGGGSQPPSDECGSVRLTSYTASDRGWCEFDRTHAFLPQSVVEGMTFAIAEPYNGSSYDGQPGESCGECWEVDTLGGTEIVMAHDLCPIQGNPLCAGGHFHFDLSSEAATALDAGGLDEGQARRVPCPVDGNIHIQINDRNEWGYLRLAFVNHRIPIRAAEYQAADGSYRAVERSGGAWHVAEDGDTFSKDGPGGAFRLTSAQGEVLEPPNVLGYDVAAGSTFDLGAQLTDQNPSSGGACVFVPPADVYTDGYGGIDEVRWTMNPWGSASASVVTDGCYEGSCIQIDDLAQWDGLHIYYRQAFPASTFSRLTLRVRALSGAGDLVVAPSHEGQRCTETVAPAVDSWSQITVDIASACASESEINAVTISNPSDAKVLLLDDVVFEQ